MNEYPVTIKGLYAVNTRANLMKKPGVGAALDAVISGYELSF